MPSSRSRARSLLTIAARCSDIGERGGGPAGGRLRRRPSAVRCVQPVAGIAWCSGAGVTAPPRNLARGPRSSSARPGGDRSSSAPSILSRRSTQRIGPRAIPRIRCEFPGCYYTSGVLADFFTRLADAALGDGSRVPVDGWRAVSLPRWQRRDDAARLRGDGRGVTYESAVSRPLTRRVRSTETGTVS